MENLKVMLVDDETLIRKLIRLKIDWEALDMAVVAEFSSSKKALEEVQTIDPDIIITDICMPGMDGIEFSEACIRLMPHIKIMILTGHDEFNYAKRSIHIGVSDYILKPINGEEITQSLKKIGRKIYEERARKTEYEELVNQIEESIPVFCEAYLNQVLLSSQSAEVFCKKMACYQVDFKPESARVQIAVLKIELPFKGGEQASENNEVMLYLKARKLTEEFFSGDSGFLFCRDSVGRIVILSNNPDVPLLECLELLNKMLVTRLKCQVTIGLGLVKDDYSHISSSYREAIEALKYKSVQGSSCIICYDEIHRNKEGFVMAMAAKDVKKTGSLIHEILLFMSENLADPELSMNKVAEHIFISTGHLGRILKKHTGRTYGEYLSELRFNKAKELLEETEMKGYELGEKIGILDAHYLSIWFKKMSGYSISDYRKNIKGINNEVPPEKDD